MTICSLYFELPKPIETIIDDPLQYIGIVHQALRDELPGSPMSIRDIDIYIAPILENLDKHFDIAFDRSNLMFYKKDNSQSWKLENIWDTLFSHGFNYFNEKEYEKSIDSYTKAISIDPSRPEAWYNRACSFYYLKKYYEMLSDMDEAIKLAPTNSKYYEERASIMHKLNNQLL